MERRYVSERDGIMQAGAQGLVLLSKRGGVGTLTEIKRPALRRPSSRGGYQAPWHFLNFLLLPQGQGSLRPTSLSVLRTGS